MGMSEKELSKRIAGLFVKIALLSVSSLVNYTPCIEQFSRGSAPAVSRRVSMATEFSRTLSLLRKERGVSQRVAAADLGVSQALLSHYENGIREPGLAFVSKVCDYYHVSADYMLGRTLARDGSMLTAEEILNAAEPGNVLQGSVLATLRGKLITSASGVLFGLLGKLGDKDAINAAADSLGCHIYLLYRLLHRAAGGSTAYFALPEEDCAAGAASAGASLARTDYARALAKLSREKAAFPDMSHETLNSAFPGRSQGMIQVLSTADGQLNRLNQSGLK